MEKKIGTLSSKLQQAFGDRLVSVILYGSAVDGELDGYSDVNVLCVLREVTARELTSAEPIFRWWRSERCPAPLLMSQSEIDSSLDCFSIEFHDIKARHRILFGADLPSGWAVDYASYRAHVERELRTKRLRLRQKAGGVLSDGALLQTLMLDSVSTFCALMRHALRLAGQQAPTGKREAASAAASQFGFEAAPFHSLLDMREDSNKAGRVKPAALFDQYLSQIDLLIAAVDRLTR